MSPLCSRNKGTRGEEPLRTQLSKRRLAAKDFHYPRRVGSKGDGLIGRKMNLGVRKTKISSYGK